MPVSVRGKKATAALGLGGAQHKQQQWERKKERKRKRKGHTVSEVQLRLRAAPVSVRGKKATAAQKQRQEGDSGSEAGEVDSFRLGTRRLMWPTSLQATQHLARRRGLTTRSRLQRVRGTKL